MAYDRTRDEEEAALQPAERRRIDFEVEVGAAYVPVGVERGFCILDPDRASALKAWTSALIPAGSHGRPAAGEVGAAEYIDATAFAAPAIRGLLLEGIDAVERIVQERYGRSLAECDEEQRTACLQDFERADTTGAFAMVHDFTYEAYYANPRALTALQEATGWQFEGAIAGSEMEPFDGALLGRMRAVKPHYREVPS